jgi:hypothetical protein
LAADLRATATQAIADLCALATAEARLGAAMLRAVELIERATEGA